MSDLNPDVRPCKGENANICAGEGCYAMSCLKIAREAQHHAACAFGAPDCPAFGEGCAHTFVQKRVRPWWRLIAQIKWICVHCHLVTRSYNGDDILNRAPIHPHMPTAFPGYNTMRGVAS